MGDRNGLKALCNSSLPGLHTCCVGIGNAVPSTPLVTQMRANRRGKRKAVRDREAECKSASKFKCCWNAEEMASPHPRFPQGLSKLLSKTVDYSYLGGNLEMLHSKFLLWQDAKLPLSAGNGTAPVWGLLSKNAWGQGQGCAATEISSPTAAQPGEAGFLDTEIGGSLPPLVT